MKTRMKRVNACIRNASNSVFELVEARVPTFAKI